MKANPLPPKLAIRAAVAGVLMSVAAWAPADLQFKISVQTTGSVSPGAPKAGVYTVVYRPGLARVEQPDGSVRILDFNAGKTALLDTKNQTYKMTSIPEALSPGSERPQSAAVIRDRTVRTMRIFGTQAERLLFNVSPPATTGRSQSRAGTTGTAGTAGTILQSQSPGATVPLPVHTMPMQTASITRGFAWVADGNLVRSTVGSVAPLVMAAVPRALAAAITQNLDSHGVIPVSFSFDWSNGATLHANVSSIGQAGRQDGDYAIPTNYKEEKAVRKND